MTSDELIIYELISEKGILLGAVDVLLRHPEDKSEELLFWLKKEKERVTKFILDLFDLVRSLSNTKK
jgi:hypothetical protein